METLALKEFLKAVLPEIKERRLPILKGGSPFPWIQAPEGHVGPYVQFEFQGHTVRFSGDPDNIEREEGVVIDGDLHFVPKKGELQEVLEQVISALEERWLVRVPVH